MLTDINDLNVDKHYTYADYVTWQFQEMVEIIRGKIFRMSPAPGRDHQQVSTQLLRALFQIVTPPFQVYHAPFDVRLPLPPNRLQADKIDTVVQPDISVICDSTKLDDKGCNGAPDWIIEILSGSTARKDLTEKYDVYQHAGVREYWIVHPKDQTVIPFQLDEKGEYQLTRKKPYVYGEEVPIGIFPGMTIPLEHVFI